MNATSPINFQRYHYFGCRNYSHKLPIITFLVTAILLLVTAALKNTVSFGYVQGMLIAGASLNLICLIVRYSAKKDRLALLAETDQNIRNNILNSKFDLKIALSYLRNHTFIDEMNYCSEIIPNVYLGTLQGMNKVTTLQRAHGLLGSGFVELMQANISKLDVITIGDIPIKRNSHACAYYHFAKEGSDEPDRPSWEALANDFEAVYNTI